ncbi:uncharacterized protein BO80DRAFT_399860 [Aspergillus ibericus CBS 121593]|uniref:Heterokaryon incompatibility domain-containing protein n=1 Tax=Aspergillus ibericus CBS 121593 TaxID=1448316 RepID=A0A395H940_9EURO|nr:hypothetical protein BO80DRAFT_399860 [Aspergillus ibericus CBS 121593]RAL04427.1 hypothetical protein BO80DRAFT_399860 [Aspergillus ibericus CBS 121593]
MNRWHESGCRRPDVSAASGILCCNYCFAVPTLEEGLKLPVLSPLDGTHYDHTWPSAVQDDNSSISGEKPKQGNCPAGPSSLQSREPGFPKITPNDGIRLVRLKAGPFDSPLHVELDVVRIHSIPVPLYDALSYTSFDEIGGQDELRPVFVGKYWDIVYVPHNCEQALRSIRGEKADRIVWVDSLSIDSADVREKSQQVALVGHIYRRATKVIAYLGPETSDSANALGFLKSIAVAGPGMTVEKMHIDKEIRAALKSLLERPYFCRIWAVQHVLLARELEVVCGRQCAPWPKTPFAQTHPDLSIPDWLFRNQNWYGLTDRDLLPILIKASPYKCCDPRDKIFAVSGLIAESGIVPDYTVSMERVYIGLTEYLVKCCNAMDVFKLAGLRKKSFDLPSWVPDWSQALCTRDIPTSTEDSLDKEDGQLPGPTHVLFNGLLGHECEIQRDAATSVLRTRAIKLCDLRGTVQRGKGYTHLSISLKRRATLYVTVPDPEYQPGADGLFILGGYDSPVILRDNLVSRGYTLVATCALSFWMPASRGVLEPSRTRGIPGITVAPLSPEEKILIREFHLSLEQASQIPSSATLAVPISFSTIRDRVLSYSMISLTPLPRHEQQLQETWHTLNSELGWMFRDQEAIWQLLQEVNRLNATEQRGEARMKIHPALVMKYCGTDSSATLYTWDLRRFCWSFLHRVDPANTAPEPHWSPILDQMMARLPDIRKWAETTEQLLRLFEYIELVVEHCWTWLPGNQLSQKWTAHYDNFCAAVGMDTPRDLLNQRPSLDETCHWDVQEFENHLRARAQLWELNRPPELTGRDANSLMVHTGLRSLGLELYDEQVVEIW